MTNQTPTPEQLQVMYNNFVKISQWLTKKDQAPSPLPPLYADILAELKSLRDKVEDLEFKQAANLEEIHYLQSLITRNQAPATPSVAEQGEACSGEACSGEACSGEACSGEAIPEPEPKKSKPKTSRKKKTEPIQAEEELPSAPSLIPAPAHLKEQEVSANESETKPEPIQTETEPLDIELDSTVFTSVSEEVSRLLDEINKKEDEDDTD